jgi:ABC-type sugar transport system permease subunit
MKDRRMAAPSLKDRAYPHSFYIPAAIVYAVLFVVPTGMAFFFSLTRWTLFDWEFIGLDNFAQFFREPFLIQGLVNTLIYVVSHESQEAADKLVQELQAAGAAGVRQRVRTA